MQTTQQQTTSNRLYIANFPQNWRKNDIINKFTPFGTITDVCVIKKNENKQYAFIEFSTILEACRAKSNLKNVKIGQKKLKVDFATWI